MSVSDQSRKKVPPVRGRHVERSAPGTQYPGGMCPADIVLRVLMGRWKTGILKSIGDHGTLHFGALKRELAGISHKVLTRQLRDLERDGILQRRISIKPRPETHYSLTARGREVQAVLDSISQLAVRWQADS
jgi:DNA-binding HxlR family transcriptional regulator